MILDSTSSRTRNTSMSCSCLRLYHIQPILFQIQIASKTALFSKFSIFSLYRNIQMELTVVVGIQNKLYKLLLRENSLPNVLKEYSLDSTSKIVNV